MEFTIPYSYKNSSKVYNFGIDSLPDSSFFLGFRMVFSRARISGGITMLALGIEAVTLQLFFLLKK